jgi:hypothetical protein
MYSLYKFIDNKIYNAMLTKKLLLIVFITFGSSNSYATVNKLCGLKISDKFVNVELAPQIKSQFDSFVPNLKYYYNNEDAKNIILISESKTEIVKDLDLAEFKKISNIAFGTIKESLESRNTKIIDIKKEFYTNKIDRFESIFEYNENGIDIFDKRISFAVPDNCFAGIISISPLEYKNKSNQEIENLIENIVYNNKNQVPISLPKKIKKEIEICNIKLKRNYYKVGVNPDHEKILLKSMGHLKYYYFSDNGKISYLLGEYPLDKENSKRLSIKTLEQSIPLLRKGITDNTADSIKINSFKSEVFGKDSSGIKIEFKTRMKDSEFFESRIMIFSSPQCRVDFIASGRVEDESTIKDELKNLHHDLIRSASLLILPKEQNKNNNLIQNLLRGGFVGGIIGAIIWIIFYYASSIFRKIKK